MEIQAAILIVKPPGIKTFSDVLGKYFSNKKYIPNAPAKNNGILNKSPLIKSWYAMKIMTSKIIPKIMTRPFLLTRRVSMDDESTDDQKVHQ